MENNINVKFAILNNGVLGMVKQWQDLFYEKDFFATIYSGNPDFVKLAEAYGIPGLRVTEQDQVSNAIQQAMEIPGPGGYGLRGKGGRKRVPNDPGWRVRQ